MEWSQAELATRVGVTRQTINAIETGRYDPVSPWLSRLHGFSVKTSRNLSRPGERAGNVSEYQNLAR